MRIRLTENMELLVHSRASRGNYIYEILSGILGRMPVQTYTNATRPAVSTVTVGTMIFNTDDGAPNWSNGTNWVDASGNVT
jgi:hypothetical protein